MGAGFDWSGIAALKGGTGLQTSAWVISRSFELTPHPMIWMFFLGIPKRSPDQGGDFAGLYATPINPPYQFQTPGDVPSHGYPALLIDQSFGSILRVIHEKHECNPEK
jgi:hypothetical protein